MPVDTKEIIEKYKKLHVDELVQLSAAPAELREDVLPFLQQELIQRGRTTEAQALADWIAFGGDKQEQEELQVNMNIDQWIKEAKRRAENEEASLEEIVKEADEHGGGTLDELKKQGWYQEAYVDYIKDLRSRGLTDEQINEKMGIAFSLADADKHHKNLKRNGAITIIAGIAGVGRGLIRYEETKKYGGGDTSQILNTFFIVLGVVLIVLGIAMLVKSSRK
ncbi:MAG TPA: hypothetical protein VHM26_00035 [Chitinophagaceae bacterium]|jgi:hypothetical protein|nr:hypothetical protein [Chitinophagaceae bacterium]